MCADSADFSAHERPKSSGDDAGEGDPGDGEGGGHRPMTVVVLAIAKAEGRSLLNDVQYANAVDIVKRLADFGNKAATVDLRIGPMKQFWALKLKGGFLKKINLRIYFAVLSDRNEIVVLMTYKKEEDRRVSPHVPLTLEDR